MTTNININKALEDFNPDFKPGFNARVMEGIRKASNNTYSALFNNAFKHIFIGGAAAVILLLITIYMSEGGLSTDSLLGTNEMDIESYTAMMFNNF